MIFFYFNGAFQSLLEYLLHEHINSYTSDAMHDLSSLC
jgi:hypothetical protein